MIKLLICLLSALAIGLSTLQLRQQQLELKHQAAILQKNIESQQARLWNQQLQIATFTAPNAITRTVGDELPLAPDPVLPEGAGNWIDTRTAASPQ